MRRLEGLPPLIYPESRTLVLGSFPGEESLRKREYYAHPQNSFWRILTLIFEPGLELKDYKEKAAFIRRHGLAIWDVLKSCQRITSADSRIRHPKANDIGRILKCYPGVSRILLNGRTAEKWGREFLKETPLPFYYVPSSSPAFASLTVQDKAEVWKRALKKTKQES